MTFSQQRLLMVFHWSLRDKNSPQVSRTLRSIQADLSNTVVWIVTARPPISTSPKHLETVLNTPITISISFTSMFHNYFSFLARSKNSSLFPFSLIFTLWSALTAKSTIRQVLVFFFFVDYLCVLSSGRDYYYYYYYFTPLRVCHTALPGSFALEFQWQQFFSSLQGSSKYSGRS